MPTGLFVGDGDRPPHQNIVGHLWRACAHAGRLWLTGGTGCQTLKRNSTTSPSAIT
jgi:hypothetical protein